ncbi:hypothetical protein BABINDRAFT_169620 [Babjeviella inositovora NRRL Y-12698]|uniref:Fatty acid hydroxylase domain-containing protein n=1 Tax=Babjeviella inositovora NRRL Y-12698 TaxID=984486 RepID=A0A1E3QX08_9ASCO|nr:uncharacterized protein BABINDRAFT_169620 [Babjeviella inositovora NRRL Y-12698]ODQ82180.1 hypothetical protein BABINDRAFT_169620 [Babjeviella inositovora NRRL Y-12698]
MDLVLEVFDYAIGDSLYTRLFPTALQSTIPPTIARTLKFGNYSDYAQLSVSNGVMLDTNAALKDVYGVFPNILPESAQMYASLLPRHNIIRQCLSLFVIMTVFGWLLYFSVAWISYMTIFDRTIFNHPRYLKNQMRLEIHQAATSIPVMVLLTVPWFLLELRGYSKLYMNIDESTGGWKAVLFQLPCFIMFTDCGIYFIHRWLHWPRVYKMLHKPHHKWIVCTPFASHAFHPVDGYAQSLPYHWFPFVFPLHKVAYLFLFTFVNFWTVMIHDGAYFSNDPFVNGTACHTIHHLYFNYNYGQFTTLWDRLGNSYRRPDDNLFDRSTKDSKQVWNDQVKKMEEIRGALEGNADDRTYVGGSDKKNM